VPPEREEPFDLDELSRVINEHARPTRDPDRKWWKPWSRSVQTTAPPELLRPNRPTATRALLALAPEPSQSEAIVAALRTTGVAPGTGPRIVLRAELPLDNELMWKPAVTRVTDQWHPFAVRLVSPEVVRDRIVALRVAGDGTAALQRALAESLADVGYPETSGLQFEAMMVLASSFDGLSVHALHELASAVRDALALPIDFTARSVFQYSESADEYDLPLSAFPFRA
jgi:hypothetical protein